MSEESTTLDPVERTRLLMWVEGLVVRAPHHNDIDQARAAAERLAGDQA